MMEEKQQAGKENTPLCLTVTLTKQIMAYLQVTVVTG